MRRYLILAIFCTAFLSSVSQVLACGGYFPDEIEYIGEVWVSAKVVEVDETGYNAILEVDRYFKGSGGKYLVVYRLPPALQIAGPIRGYDTGCLYAGGGYIWQVDSYGYFALKPNNDGTYDDYGMLTSGWGPGSGHYIPAHGMVEFYSKDEPYTITMPTYEFETLLLEYGARSHALPAAANPYPLKHFLNITTESGARYRLNPDRSLTVLDPRTSPAAISNDGTHVMFRLDTGELEFQYLWLNKRVNGGITGRASVAHSSSGSADNGNPVRPGYFGTFSPDSNVVAIQEAARLAVYRFKSVQLEGAIVGYGNRMAMQDIASFDVKWQSAEKQQPLIWSASSNAIAYQDTRGIWLWKIYEYAEPELIIPSAEGQSLLGLSASGRYLRFGAQASWTLLDTLSGEAWSDTIVKLDESRLLHFLFYGAEDYMERLEEIRNCPHPRTVCPGAILPSPGTGLDHKVPLKEILWYEPNFLLLVYDNGVESMSMSPSLPNWPCRIRNCQVELPSIDAFAFDPRYDQPAFAYEGTKIGLSLRESDNYYDSIDLGEYLDSPIVDLEWGQPIFYEGR